MTKGYLREQLDAALAREGVASVSEWVAARPGQHLWVDLPWDNRALRACAACSIVQRADKQNKPCPGIVPVTPRIDGKPI